MGLNRRPARAAAPRAPSAGARPIPAGPPQASTPHRPPDRPTWERAVINLGDDHLELCYGTGQTPVARVGLDVNKHILVQFLIEAEDGKTASQRMLNEVESELSYYLFGVAGAHAWAFARFHCDTPANFASRVRWSWHPGRSPRSSAR